MSTTSSVAIVLKTEALYTPFFQSLAVSHVNSIIREKALLSGESEVEECSE